MSRLPASGLRQRKHASKKCTPCPAPPIDLFSRWLSNLSTASVAERHRLARSGACVPPTPARSGVFLLARSRCRCKSSVLFFLPPCFPARLRRMRGDAWWGGNARWCALAFNNGGGRAALARLRGCATPQDQAWRSLWAHLSGGVTWNPAWWLGRRAGQWSRPGCGSTGPTLPIRPLAACAPAFPGA